MPPRGGPPPGERVATGKSSVPKYTIRLVLIWLLPLLSLLLGPFLLLPCLLAALLTPIEVPKVRQRLFSSRMRKQLPCLKVPALMRLSVLWVLQVWWFILWRAEGGLPSPPSGAAAAAAGGGGAGAPAPGEELEGPPTLAAAAKAEAGAALADEADAASLAWAPRSLSVVLPCAGEGEYALKTVRAVYETTPKEALREIIVVDDGSSPALSDSHLNAHVRTKYGVRVIRHERTVGLIGAKKDGGDAATGDIVVFFDCHVAPQPGWHGSFLRLIGENYRRIVVPVITDLDVGTWRQRGGNKGQAKCYLTWDADFKWFESDDEYVPILSGGLLGISRRWWNETGGYDEQMVGWGGENLDQSLRSWLCGGEIMIAKDAFVAHMWRTPSDPRTAAHYRVKAGAANANRMRAASAWFGEFSAKLRQFPSLGAERKAWGGGPWYGDLENILAVKRRLRCRSFAWFMHRFKHVYEDGGLVPSETFHLRATPNSQCLTYTGPAGTSPDGKGRAVLRTCDPDDDRQRWHGANRDSTLPGQPCCSGLRAWNTDQCLAGVADTARGGARTFVCDVSGAGADQAWSLSPEGQLRRRGGGFMQSSCLEADKHAALKVQGCRAGGGPQWAKHLASEPIESQLYRRALAGGEA